MRCFGRDVPIMMFDGSVKPAQEIRIGDQLMGDDSNPRLVTSTRMGRDKLYRINQSKAHPYIVNGDHELCLKYIYHPRMVGKTVHTTIGRGVRKESNYTVSWMKDGEIMNRVFSTSNYGTEQQAQGDAQNFYHNLMEDSTYDKGKIKEIPVKEFMTLGEEARLYRGFKARIEYPYRPTSIDPHLVGYWLGSGNTVEDIQRRYPNTTKDLDPDNYFTSDRPSRLSTLAGMIDSTSTSDRSSVYTIVVSDSDLAEKIVKLARSLGFKVEYSRLQDMYEITISGQGIEDIPVTNTQKRFGSGSGLSEITIEPLGDGDIFEIMVDQNHRFVLEDLTVVKN